MKLYTYYTLIALFCIGLSSSLMAQDEHGICGTQTTIEDLDRITELKKSIPDAQLRERLDFKVRYHVITETDGSNGLDLRNVLKNMESLNTFYSELTDIHFHLDMKQDGFFNFIANSNYYNDPSGSIAFQRFLKEKESDAINIFVALNARPNSQGPGTVLAYYTPQGDFIVSRKDRINQSSTLAHELGHFFDLAHPFFGWEGDPWTESKHGSPVKVTYTGTNILIELMDKSNCETSADRICDTPPDYNFGLTQSGCTFTRNVKDKNGDRVITMENNLMGYFDNCAEYEITEGQKDIVLASAASSRRAHLKTGFQPLPDIGEYTIEFQDGFNSGDELDYKNATLNWKDVPNAQAYFVEYDIYPNFSSPQANYGLTYESKITLSNDIFKGRKIYFRILPFNASDFYGLEVSPRFEFIGSNTTSLSENELSSSIKLFPNPVNDFNDLSFDILSQQSGDANVAIYDITGKKLVQNSYPVSIGINSNRINTGELDNGLYMVRVSIGNEVISKKLLIQR